MKALARASLLCLLGLASSGALASPSMDLSLQVAPSAVLPGQAITVSMQVYNNNSTTISSLSPLLTAVQNGFFGSFQSSPVPVPVLAGHSYAGFTWTFSGGSCGDVYFTGSASGNDGGTGSSAPVSSTVVVMICTPTATPVVVYATVTPQPQGNAVALGNIFHPLLGQPLEMDYLVPFAGEVTVSIYNRNGKKVKEFQVAAGAGKGSLSWDGRSDEGALVPSGIYAALFRGKGLSKVVKLVVVK